MTPVPLPRLLAWLDRSAAAAHGEEDGAFLIAADGSIEGVEVGLERLSDIRCDVRELVLRVFGRGRGGGGVGDVGFQFADARCEILDCTWGERRCTVGGDVGIAGDSTL